ncbi:MAG: succinylglutamate desuccinylase/aspartoacylase family protein [Nanoarchaeota archaeon]
MSNIKVIEKEGKEPGKTITILAGIHGNETCGIKAFDEIIPNIEIKKGKVIFIYANLEAINKGKRFIEYNLNRSFFKNQIDEIKNTIEGKTAREIINILEKTDFLLDIHSSNTHSTTPFIICEKNSFEIAKKLPFDIITYNWDKFEPGSTEYYMNLKNKIGICIECGFTSDKRSEEKAKDSIMTFLNILGAIKNKRINKNKQEYYKIIDLYKNKDAKFEKDREFNDFYMLKEKTLIGKEGVKKIYLEKGKVLIFVRNRDKTNEECFIIAEKREEDNLS